MWQAHLALHAILLALPVGYGQFLWWYNPREPGLCLGALDRLLRGLEPVAVLGVREEVVRVHRRLEGGRGQEGLQWGPPDQSERGASEDQTS